MQYGAERYYDDTRQYETEQAFDNVQVIWTLAAVCGVRGFHDVVGVYADQSSPEKMYEEDIKMSQQVLEMAADVSAMGGSAGSIYQQDYRYLPYNLRNGEVQALSRWNMCRQRLTVSRVQCKVRVSDNGAATLTSCGKGPTLWRSWDGLWNGLNQGERQLLANGDQVSLDWQDPEAAVFTCQVQSAMQQSVQQVHAPDLPAGWISAVDPASGAAFYYNQQTGASQWEPPGECRW